ncbi:MAG: hypothetical protein CL911_03520 [Deltaproteobacteria bacterium]|nr:hypothetical protein [Deltaproteobacteria bacterium]
MHPGEVLLQQGSGCIQTLLGACVAGRFWDPQKYIGGMNHITLPLRRHKNAPSARYGNVGTFVLLDPHERSWMYALDADSPGSRQRDPALTEQTPRLESALKLRLIRIRMRRRS